VSITLYGEALHSDAVRVHLRDADGGLSPLPAARWRDLDEVDVALLDRLSGWTLDVGCGPGRFGSELAARGVPVLGIDIAPAAVSLTRGGGGLALRRDVFGPVPGEGRWRWLLLVDGNIGIGGDPLRLLRRTRTLLADDGRAHVEVEGPGCARPGQQVRLEHGTRVGPWFPWAWVSVDELPMLATAAGLTVTDSWTQSGRWFAELAVTVT
jgi:SAM-dependent methyltransferase